MIPELNDEKRIFSDFIDETVLFVYPSGPVTGLLLMLPSVR